MERAPSTVRRSIVPPKVHNSKNDKGTSARVMCAHDRLVCTRDRASACFVESHMRECSHERARKRTCSDEVVISRTVRRCIVEHSTAHA